MRKPELTFLATSPAPSEPVIKLAVLAVGGQGGGVLSDWIVATAERSGYIAQSTSVAGVAQRTGATIYYVEMARDTGRLPIFALSPSPGDVDIMIAAELMEAGRAIMRGFVTPERTTLIASSHRIAAVSEKIEPGDGRASSEKVVATAERASKRFIAFDMEKIAAENGTMISASLFGALAGCGVLPFPREAYEETIKGSGRGVKPSLGAFGVAFDRTAGTAVQNSPFSVSPFGLDTSPPVPGGEDGSQARPSSSPSRSGGEVSSPKGETERGAFEKPLDSRDGTGVDKAAEHGALRSLTAAERAQREPAVDPVSGPKALVDDWQSLAARVAAMPEPARDMALRGLRKVVDYQDIAYGAQYLDLLGRAVAVDSAARGHALSIAAAKHVANALCYDDMIRVADLKTRSTRDARVRREVGVKDGSVLQVTEYFHPRVEEFCGTLPAGLGRYVEARPKLAAFIDRRINKGRRIRTDSMTGFAMLWMIGGLRRFRRKLLRHQVEGQHLDAWYRLALGHAAANYDLAVEILNCRRLIKGYSDTHVRGQSKFDRVLSALPLLEGRSDAADWLRRLREAALKDEKGVMLDGALKTVATLDDMPSASVH